MKKATVRVFTAKEPETEKQRAESFERSSK